MFKELLAELKKEAYRVEARTDNQRGIQKRCPG